MYLKTLINYPHGLGDHILLSPMLRLCAEKRGPVDVCMTDQFVSSELYRNCPYVNKVIPLKHPWHDYPGGAPVGFVEVEKAARKIYREGDYDHFITINQHPGVKSKIVINMEALSVANHESHDLNTEVWISTRDRIIALKWLADNGISNEYGFVHGISHLAKNKNLPENWGYDYCKRQGLKSVVEVGKSFEYDELNINSQFFIMKRASTRVLMDSVFFHAACALSLNIDIAYFARGEKVHERVKPQHESSYNLFYDLSKVNK